MNTRLSSRLPANSVKNRAAFNRVVSAYYASSPNAQYGILITPGFASSVKLSSSQFTNLKTNNSGGFIEFLPNSTYLGIGGALVAVLDSEGVTLSGARKLRATSAVGGQTNDTWFVRVAAANWQIGDVNSAAPVPQTLSFQSVVGGTSNGSGPNAAIKAPAGTGSGTGGDIVIQVAPAGSPGTAPNAHVDGLRIGGNLTVTLYGPIVNKSYTVAGLPTGVLHMRTMVTDALAPSFGSAVVGGGAVIVPVYFDGAWKVG